MIDARPSHEVSPSAQFGTWEQAIEWVRTQPEYHKLLIDAYYDDPLADAAERYWRSDEWRGVRKWLPNAPGRALDVGAGRGIASYALARDGFQVNALEPDGSSLVGAQAIRALAAQTGLAIDVTQEFSERLPFADQQFNVVFARAVLHHTKDMAAACREFMRVLKRGGVLIAVREHVLSRTEDLSAFFDIHPLHKLYGGENAYLLEQYLGAIRAAGLELKKVLAPLDSAINYAPYTLLQLQSEIALRIGRRVPGGAAVVRTALRLRGAWPITRALLQLVDHRPGRLYSFVAQRV